MRVLQEEETFQISTGTDDQRDCFVLGCGRSGTSLAAGMLSKCGYFMGENLYDGDADNPRGYFESHEINYLNEMLLESAVPAPKASATGLCRQPGMMQRWLASPPLDIEFQENPDLEQRIRLLVSDRPFCFKDPRFSFTLTQWRRFAPQASQLCVFRHPHRVVSSVLVHASRKPYLDSLYLDESYITDVWRSVYSHILKNFASNTGSWLFVHYNQLLDGSASARIAHMLGIVPDSEFLIQRPLEQDSRSSLSEPIKSLYEDLCELAMFSSG
jgi:hypothetical protein